MVPHQNPKQLISSERQAATQRALESVFVELRKQALEANEADVFYSKFQPVIKDESQVMLPMPPGEIPEVNLFVKVELRVTAAGTTDTGGLSAAESAALALSEYESVIKTDNLRPSVYEFEQEFLKRYLDFNVSPARPLYISNGSLKISFVKRSTSSSSQADKSRPAMDDELAQWWKDWIDSGQMNGSDVDIMNTLYTLPRSGQISWHLISKNFMAELWLRGVGKEEFLNAMGVAKE